MGHVAMSSPDILVDRDEAVAAVTINRPAQRNAISFDMWRELAGVLTGLDADRQIRAVIITGAGGEAFSAGADISDFEEHRSDSTKGRRYNDAVNGLLAAVSEMSTPTISMIRGFAVGGGCELAIATDLRIAAEGSTFGIPVARLGISIGHREMRGLVDLVGKGNALYILLSGRLIGAREAKDMGLVNQVTTDEDLEEVTYGLAREMAALAPFLTRSTSLRCGSPGQTPLCDLTPEEAELPIAQFDTLDYREGYRAFLEKRRPLFRGE